MTNPYFSQALNFMAAGGGLPHHFPGHPLAGHQAAAAAAAAHAHHPGGPHGPPGPHALASLAAAGAAAQAAAAAAHSQSGRPTSTPSTPSSSFPGKTIVAIEHICELTDRWWPNWTWCA